LDQHGTALTVRALHCHVETAGVGLDTESLVAVMRVALAAMGAANLAACVSLLPSGSTATQDGWPDYETARGAIEHIVPRQTRRAELTAEGIDPYKTPAITILNYSDIVQRFAVSGAIRHEELDAGILECLQAGKACTGYAIQIKSTTRKRTGGFWMDIFNFRRETDITGWTFSAMILMVDDLVVYTLHGGQPRIHEKEVSRNPLGPVQESLPSLLVK
jgi:hypothetical protein